MKKSPVSKLEKVKHNIKIWEHKWKKWNKCEEKEVKD